MKTVKRDELSNLRMVAGNEEKYKMVILKDGLVDGYHPGREPHGK